MNSSVTRRSILTKGYSTGILATRWSAVLPVIATLLVAGSTVVSGLTLLSLQDLVATGGLTSLLLAAATYSIAHVLRAGRLLLLIGFHTISVRRLVEAHFLTAGLSMIVPLKLGEIYRAIELKAVTGSYSRAILAVWIERSFDVAAICTVAAMVTFMHPANYAELEPLLFVSTIFVIATVTVFAILPKSLASLSLFIIRRYNSNGAVEILRVISLVNRFVSRPAEMIKGKLVGLGLTTAIIWYLEALVISLTLENFASWSSTALRLLQYLSAVSTGMTAPFTPPSDLAASGLASLHCGMAELIAYEFSMRIPLMLLAMAAGISYSVWRVRTRPSVRRTTGRGASSLFGRAGQ